jgi:hypothetical protein
VSANFAGGGAGESVRGAASRLIARERDGITRIATGFTKSRGDGRGPMCWAAEGEAGRLEFANLPHDFAETLELVFVGITIVATLAILVVVGNWWQK